MDTLTDNIMPDTRWQFDDSVTTVFDDMLARSIPQYDVMRQTCFEIGSKYVQPNSWIIDLGCSRGEALAPFVQSYKAENQFLGIEISPPMLTAASTRFSNEKQVLIRGEDLRLTFPQERASVILAILTIQFIPIEYRQRIIRQCYQNLVNGGALVFVEKVLGATSELNQNMVSIYCDLKRHNGYTQEQIERKRLSLEGVLVPVTAAWNEELLRQAGFTQVDCFWRWMNFAGWIAVKE